MAKLGFGSRFLRIQVLPSFCRAPFLPPSEQAPVPSEDMLTPAFLPPLPPRQLHDHGRGTAQMRWLTGERVRPILNFRLSFSLSGGLKVNFCTREVKKMNSSDLANCSPRHTRFPERQKDKTSYLPSWCWCPAGTEIFYHVLQNMQRKGLVGSGTSRAETHLICQPRRLTIQDNPGMESLRLDSQTPVLSGSAPG